MKRKKTIYIMLYLLVILLLPLRVEGFDMSDKMNRTIYCEQAEDDDEPYGW